MDDLLAARLQMGISLGFHILFAVSGMAMPWLMVLAEWRHLRTRNPIYKELALRWARGTAILFAVGAVSGTVLSFELGLLWPRFMALAGPLIGMPFSLEGFAFFLEAIALGVYLYGWQRVPERMHLASGLVIAVSGLMSGVFVMAVNAFMNTPRGFQLDAQGQVVDVNLVEAFFTPAFPTQAVHMVFAAYASVSFAVLGIHAWRLLKSPDNSFHRAAMRLVLPFALVSAPLMLLTGDFSAKHLAAHQPAKLAAAEALFETTDHAPLLIGGLPDVDEQTVPGALPIPAMLSVLAKGSPDATVAGLDQVPRADWPPVVRTHLSFQLMVAAGMGMLLLSAWLAWLYVRRRDPTTERWFLIASCLAAPLGLLAVEAGWCVTEFGRQPWIIKDLMRVADAVTPMPGLTTSLVTVTVLYLVLGAVVAMLLRRHVLSAPEDTAAAERRES